MAFDFVQYEAADVEDVALDVGADGNSGFTDADNVGAAIVLDDLEFGNAVVIKCTAKYSLDFGSVKNFGISVDPG